MGADQLLHVHRLLTNWQQCKADLDAGTAALSAAAHQLRAYLNTQQSAHWATQPGRHGVWGQGGDLHAGEGDLPRSPAATTGDRPPSQGNQWPAALHVGCPDRSSAPVERRDHGNNSGNANEDGSEAELCALACQELAQAQYLHALALCAAGRGPEADPWVAGLGFQLRLSDPLWAACIAQMELPADPARTQPPAGAAAEAAAAAVTAGAAAAAGCSRRPPAFHSAETDPQPRQPRGDGAHCQKLAAELADDGERGPVSTPILQPRPEPAWGLLETASEPALPVLLHGALPRALLERLALAFDPAGPTPFWRQHQYGKQRTPFFSYLYRLDQPPASVVEDAIRHLHQRLLLPAPGTTSQPIAAGGPTASGTTTPPAVTTAAGNSHIESSGRAAVAAAMRNVCVVEWWAHTRAAGGAHQLHFDVNEDLLRRGPHEYRLCHPVLSSVLYLPPAVTWPPSGREAEPPHGAEQAAQGQPHRGPSRGAKSPDPQLLPQTITGAGPWGGGGRAAGGPTLVLDQTPAGSRPDPPQAAQGGNPGSELSVGKGAAPLARRAWPVAARPNCLLVFPGDLLHGVMPQPRYPRAQASGPAGGYLATPGSRRQPPRRTTLIMAWWGPERLQTACPAPPLVLRLLPARRALTSDAEGGGGGGGRGVKRTRAQTEPGREPGDEAGQPAGIKVDAPGVRCRGASETDDCMGPRSGESGGGRGRGRDTGSSSSNSNSSSSTTTTSCGTSSTDSDSSNRRGNSGSSMQTSSSGADTADDDTGTEEHTGAEADGSDGPGVEAQPGPQSLPIVPPTHGSAAGCHSLRGLVDWRYAGPLRSGMELPVHAAAADSNRARRVGGPGGSTDGRTAGEHGGSSSGSGPSLRGPAGGSMNPHSPGQGDAAQSQPGPPAVPQRWVQWFAELMARGPPPASPAAAAAVLLPTGGAGSAGQLQWPGEGSPVWRHPAPVNPAWVRVRQGPLVGRSASTGAGKEGGEGGGPQAPRRGREREKEDDQWDLGRQALRGVALVMGLSSSDGPPRPALRNPRGGPEDVALTSNTGPTGAAASASHRALDTQDRTASTAAAEAYAAATAATGAAAITQGVLTDPYGGTADQGADPGAAGGPPEDPEPPVWLRAAMHALDLPQLRLFLAHPLDLQRMYLPGLPGVQQGG